MFFSRLLVAFFTVLKFGSAYGEAKFYFPQMSERIFGKSGGSGCDGFLETVASSSIQSADNLSSALKGLYGKKATDLARDFPEFKGVPKKGMASFLKSKLGIMDRGKKKLIEKHLYAVKIAKDLFLSKKGLRVNTQYFPELAEPMRQGSRRDWSDFVKAIRKMPEESLDNFISRLYIVDVISAKFIEGQRGTIEIPVKLYPEIKLGEKRSDDHKDLLQSLREAVGALDRHKLEDLANRLFILEELEKRFIDQWPSVDVGYKGLPRSSRLELSIANPAIYYPGFERGLGGSAPRQLGEVVTEVAGFDSDDLKVVAKHMHLANLIEQEAKKTIADAYDIANLLEMPVDREGVNDPILMVIKTYRDYPSFDIDRLITKLEDNF